MMTPEDLLAEATAAALPPSRQSRGSSRGHRQAPRSGPAKGGRSELDRLALAEGFADQNRDASGALLLRWWRSGWWRFRKGAWASVPSADIESELSGYIARHSRSCGKMLREDVRDGLQGVNLCGLSGVEMPCFLSSGAAAESAEGWLAAGATLIHPQRLAAGLPDAVRPASPSFFSSVCLPYSFDPEAACPLWEKALAQWHTDAAARRHLQMMAGLAVTGVKSHNVFFLIPGEKGAGKSTFADVLKAMIGRANVCDFSLSSLGDKSTYGALTRAALAVCLDSEGERDRGDLAAAEGFLKLATGGEEVQVRELHRNGYSAKCRALVVMFANDLPPFKDRSGALILDRLRVIRFHRVFRNTADEVRDLSASIIAEELPGVLNWALEGARMAAAERRFPELPAGRAEKEKHFRESDSARLFIAEVLEACAGLPGLGIVARDLFTEYQTWARGGGFHPSSEVNFGRAVERAFPGAVTNRERHGGGNPVSTWRGIRKRADSEGF